MCEAAVTEGRGTALVRGSDRPDAPERPWAAPPGAGRGRIRVPDAPGAALAVLAVAGVCVAALLLRSPGGLPLRGRGPLGRNGAVVVLGALACAAVLHPVCKRLRGRFVPQYVTEVSARQRLAHVARWTLGAAPFGAALLVLLLHRFSSKREPQRAKPSQHGVLRQLGHPPTTPPAAQPHGHSPGWLGTVLTVAASLAGLAVVVLALWVLLRSLRRRGRAESAEDFTVLGGEQERLAEAVDSGRRALLLGDDARTAVIACYAAMEESLAASGVVRQRSDSPQDLLERAVADGLPAASAAAVLTDLFREARYSSHPMDHSHRTRASEALAEIASGLAARADRQAAAAGAGGGA